MNKIKRALISVSNKENLKPLLAILKKYNIEILSSVEPIKKSKNLNSKLLKYRILLNLQKF